MHVLYIISVPQVQESWSSSNENATAIKDNAVFSLKTEIACQAVEIERLIEDRKENSKKTDARVEELQGQIKILQRENDKESNQFKEEVAKIQNYNDNLLELSKEKDKQLKLASIKIKKLKKEMLGRKTKLKQKEVFDEIKKQLSSVLTSNQIDLITKRRKQVKWTKQELETGFTLRFFGISQYNFLRNQMKLPLPSMTTLRRYAAD
jgi:Transposase protein